MADETFTPKRVKENPSTGTIRGDVSKFIINPLKDLFKEKEDEPKFDTKLPEIKITKETAEKVIKKAINSNDQPSLKDLATTADLKLKAEENPETAGWVKSLIFATGGQVPEIGSKKKTEIANDLAFNNDNIIKINNKTYVNTDTGENIYQNIGKTQLTSQAINGLLEAGYSIGQLLTIPVDLALDEKWELTQKLDNLRHDFLYNKNSAQLFLILQNQ